MRKDKELALQLRRSGKTYGEIRKLLGGISKSTLTAWFDGLAPIDDVALLKGRVRSRYLAAQGHRRKRERAIANIIIAAQAEFVELLKNPLFLSGLSFYWAEGDKNLKERVKFTNSDPRMIAIMMRWFREICRVPEEKFRIALHVHNLQIADNLEEYWSKITGVPLQQFQKTYIKETTLRHRRNVLYNGTCAIVVSDRALFRRISGWKLGLVEHFKNPPL